MEQMTIDRSEIAEEWEKRGFSCSTWIDPPGQVWRNYVHTTDELLMLVAGQLEVEMGGTSRRPITGEELLIPAGIPHTVKTIGPNASEWLYGYRRG